MKCKECKKQNGKCPRKNPEKTYSIHACKQGSTHYRASQRKFDLYYTEDPEDPFQDEDENFNDDWEDPTPW